MPPLPPRRRLLVMATTVAGGVAVGALAGSIGSLAAVAVLFIAAVVARVWSVESGRDVPRWAGMCAIAAGAILATRLVLWFGVLGAIVAIVLIVVLLISAGADLG